MPVTVSPLIMDTNSPLWTGTMTRQVKIGNIGVGALICHFKNHLYAFFYVTEILSLYRLEIFIGTQMLPMCTCLWWWMVVLQVILQHLQIFSYLKSISSQSYYRININIIAHRRNGVFVAVLRQISMESISLWMVTMVTTEELSGNSGSVTTLSRLQKQFY